MIATFFISFVLCMFTAFHIGRCVTTYKLYANCRKNVLHRISGVADKYQTKNYWLNNYVEVIVALMGVVAVVVYFLTHVI